jgi:O-acetyl-ADP-ribose deacetylase (regulator of RNase III)
LIRRAVGDLLEYPGLTHIVHQANLYHTFGSGIAKQIRERFPAAYSADLSTKHGDMSKLGSFSMAMISPSDCRVVINMYSQVGISSTDRTTDYGYMEKSFMAIRDWLDQENLSDGNDVVLGMPYRIGCGLAGGDWDRVSSLIVSIFSRASFDTVICHLEGEDWRQHADARPLKN